MPGLVSPAPTKSLKGPCTMALLRHANRLGNWPLFGEDRKQAAHGQTNANDPGCVKTCARRARRIVFSIVLSRQLSPALWFFKLIEVETKFPFANSISAFSRPSSLTGLSLYQSNRSDPKDAVSWAMDGRRLFVPFSLRSFGPELRRPWGHHSVSVILVRFGGLSGSKPRSRAACSMVV